MRNYLKNEMKSSFVDVTVDGFRTCAGCRKSILPEDIAEGSAPVRCIPCHLDLEERIAFHSARVEVEAPFYVPTPLEELDSLEFEDNDGTSEEKQWSEVNPLQHARPESRGSNRTLPGRSGSISEFE